MEEEGIVREAALQDLQARQLEEPQPAGHVQLVDVALVDGLMRHLDLVETPVLDQGHEPRNPVVWIAILLKLSHLLGQGAGCAADIGINQSI